MCDLDHIEDDKGLNRRDFGAAAAMAALAALVPAGAAMAQGGLTETNVKFDGPGGTIDAFFVHPASGKHPAVILWPDIAGVREAKKIMARRLASAGYTVIVPNPYYRSAPGPQFTDFNEWRSSGGMQKVQPWMAQNTPEAVGETAKAIVAWLDKQASVNTAKGIGVQGYCMTGSWTIRAASAAPSRIKAAASFHGGGLVAAAANSPEKVLSQGKGAYLIAIAQDDDARAPTDKDALKAAAATSKRPVEIEVYKGNHGWTVPDSPAYNKAEADRAWERLLALYKTAL